MKRSSSAVVALAWLIGEAAVAHTQLSSSTPANEAVLESAPEQVTLSFSEPVRLTALTLTADGAASSELGPLPGGMTERFAIQVPSLAAGRYVVNWRALSKDTHVVTGELTFTVTDDRPDHAQHSAP